MGIRLGLHALHHDYGKTDIVCNGLVFRSMEIEDNQVVITFDNATDGLDV